MSFIISAYFFAFCAAVGFIKVSIPSSPCSSELNRAVFTSFIFFPVAVIAIAAVANVFNSFLGIAGMYTVLRYMFYFFIGAFFIAVITTVRGRPVHYGFGIFPPMLLASFILVVGNWPLPIFGWDAIGFWTAYAADFLNYASQGITEPFTYWNYKHPRTASYIQILSYGFWPDHRDSISLIPLNFLMVALPIYGFFKLWAINNFNRYSLVLPILVVSSIPLLENQITIAGYAEVYLFSLILVVCALIALRKYFSKPHIVVAAAYASAAMLMTLKTIGPYIFLLLIVAHIIISLKPTSRACGIIALLAVSSVFLIYVYGVSFAFFGHHFELNASFHSVKMGGWEMPIEFNGLAEIFTITMVAFAINNSFGIWPLAIIVALAYLQKNKVRFSMDAVLIATFGFLILTLICLHAVLTQYGLNHALPGADTGFSRFSLAGFAPSVIVLIMIIFQENEKQADGHGRTRVGVL